MDLLLFKTTAVLYYNHNIKNFRCTSGIVLVWRCSLEQHEAPLYLVWERHHYSSRVVWSPNEHGIYMFSSFYEQIEVIALSMRPFWWAQRLCLPKHTPGTTHIHRQRTISEVTLRVSANGTPGVKGSGAHARELLFIWKTYTKCKVKNFRCTSGMITYHQSPL